MQENSFQSSSLTEKQIEAAIASSRTNHYTYMIIAVFLFLLANTGGYIALTAIPIFMYEPKYLCYSKSTQAFTVNCSQSEICDKTLNIDYIPNPDNINLKTFITSFDISCNKPKKVFLETGYFIGGLLGIAVIPFLISNTGCLNSIIIGYIILFFSSCFLSFVKQYACGVILYILFNMALSILITCTPQYLTEMVDPKYRALFICIQFLSIGTSGYLSVLIAYTSYNYKYVISAAAGISLVFAIVFKMFLVDSIRTSFIRGRQSEILKNLEYIARINKSQLEYKVWRDHNVNSAAIMNEEGAKKENQYTSFISIWKYPSQVKLIVLFSIASFIANYGLLLIQLEIKKQNNFFSSLCIAFLCDIIGILLGSLSSEIPFLKRKLSFAIINGALIIAYLFNAIFYKKHYTGMFILMRIFSYALFSNYTVYNFEAYPTMTRPIGVSINRLFARVFNLWTPYLMISHPRTGYILGVFFCAAIVGMLTVFWIEETKGEVIKEFPIEMYDGNKEKNEESDLLIKEEDNFKEK